MDEVKSRAMSFIDSLLRRNREPVEGGPLFAQVKAAMSDVQAYARSHGGRIQLLAVTDEGEVRIKLTGACDGCPLSNVTVKLGIETQLRALVPGVTRVTQVA